MLTLWCHTVHGTLQSPTGFGLQVSKQSCKPPSLRVAPDLCRSTNVMNEEHYLANPSAVLYCAKSPLSPLPPMHQGRHHLLNWVRYVRLAPECGKILTRHTWAFSLPGAQNTICSFLKQHLANFSLLGSSIFYRARPRRRWSRASLFAKRLAPPVDACSEAHLAGSQVLDAALSSRIDAHP